MSLAATYTARKRGRLGKSQTCAAPSDSARPPVALTPLLSCSRHRLLACPFSWHCGGGRLATGARYEDEPQPQWRVTSSHPKQRRALAICVRWQPHHSPQLCSGTWSPNGTPVNAMYLCMKKNGRRSRSHRSLPSKIQATTPPQDFATVTLCRILLPLRP